MTGVRDLLIRRLTPGRISRLDCISSASVPEFDLQHDQQLTVPPHRNRRL